MDYLQQWSISTWVAIGFGLLLLLAIEGSLALTTQNKSLHAEEIATLKAKADDLVRLRLAKLEMSIMVQLANDLHTMGVDHPLDTPFQHFELPGQFRARYKLYRFLMSEAPLPLTDDPLHPMPQEQSTMRSQDIQKAFTQRIESLRAYQAALSTKLFVDKPTIE